MFRRTVILLLMLSCSLILGAETKIIPLPDVNKPGDQLFTDGEKIYITENTSIFIYSMDDFKLLKKFGKDGEGPQEFKLNPRAATGLFLDVSTENIIVTSSGKVSWFTKEGQFINEKRLANPATFAIKAFGKNYTGMQLKQGDDKLLYMTLNLYDSDFNIIKEFKRRKHVFQRGQGLKVLEPFAYQDIYKDKLYTAWDAALLINVFDTDAKELYKITHHVEPLKVTQKDKDKVLNFIKNDPGFKQVLPFLKPITFPSHFPAMVTFFIDSDKIYVPTAHILKSDEIAPFLVFDLKGKYLNKVKWPLKKQDPIRLYPFAIHNETIYQCIENFDEEEWEMHITPLK